MSSRPAAAIDPEDDFDDDSGSGLDRDLDDTHSGQHRALKSKRLFLDLLGRWHWVALGLLLGGLGAMYYLSKAPKQYAAREPPA
jgi:hypothetical protein